MRSHPASRRGEGWAGTAEILERSPDRVEPRCAHFGACGGCSLQHWREPAYAAWKTDLLRAALRRAGYPDAPIAPLVSVAPNTRRRIDFAVRRVPGGVELGLHEKRGAGVVDITACAVLHPKLDALIGPLRVLLRGLSALKREGSAVLNLLESGPDLLLRTDGALSTADRARLAEFARAHGLPRITSAAGRVEEPASLLRPATTRLSGVTVHPPPGAFLQATAESEAAIIAAVLAGLPDKLPPRARIAELYAGSGTLTFALAQRARVAAYEGDPAAFAALKSAVNSAQLAGRIQPHHRDLARQPLPARDLAPFSAVVLDPPHAGAAAQTAQIAASGVKRAIYVSCNPGALTRDAQVLKAAGYALLSAVPIDQFLWSARLESVCVFGR
ncbi:MAG TPA: RsmD family RNA methyltransferase [Acetobacteraceae bacterium]